MTEDELSYYPKQLLEFCDTPQQRSALKELWESCNTQEEFEKKMLGTEDKDLLGSRAYAVLFNGLPYDEREPYARRMFERVIADKDISPRSAISKFKNGEHQTVVIIGNIQAEVAVEEERLPTAEVLPYGVVAFDYTHVLPDSFKCQYPFNKYMRTDGGQYYLRICEGSEATVGFRAYNGGELELTSIKLEPGHYEICAVSGYIFIKKYDDSQW